MATLVNRYIDTADFATATAVWLDAAFSTKAPDGWYQSCGTVREQVGGFLTPPDSCVVCDLECDDGTPGRCATLGGFYSGEMWIPINEVNNGAGTGAVDVTVTTTGIFLPISVAVTYDGTTYTELVSSNFGFLAGPYVGDTANFIPYGFPGGSPYLVPQYEWGGGTCDNFAPTSSSDTYTILPADVDGVAGDPGLLKMFIPKPNGDPSSMSIKIVMPIGGTAASWEMTNHCVAPLIARAASGNVASSVLACAEAFTTTIYNGPVNGTPGILGLYDVVFVDENAEVKLVDVSGAGFYKWDRPVPFVTDGWFEIDANSVIVSIGSCP